jgi:hypothetical protein
MKLTLIACLTVLSLPAEAGDFTPYYAGPIDVSGDCVAQNAPIDMGNGTVLLPDTATWCEDPAIFTNPVLQGPSGGGADGAS